MFAIVESDSIKEMMNGNKGITIGDIQYPADIFTKWTERGINIVGVVIGDSNEVEFIFEEEE